MGNGLVSERFQFKAKWGLLFCLLLAVLVTANAWKGPFLLDDQSKIVDNPDIRHLSNIPSKLIYPYHSFQVTERNDPSRPLVFLIYTLLYAVGGLSTIVYHAFNALVHGLTGWAVFLVARRLQETLWGRRGDLWPFVLAVLFLVTPIQVGTALYAYGLNDLLSSCFCLYSFYFAIRRESFSWGDLLVSLVMMFLALACKQSAVALVGLLVVYELTVEASGRRLLLRWNRWGPHLGLVLAYVVFRMWYFGGVGDLEAQSNTQTRFDYMGHQPLVILKYLYLTLIPQGLAFDHYITLGMFPAALRWSAGLAGLALSSMLAFGWLIKKHPGFRIPFFGWFWFLVVLLPTSSLFPTVDFLVERRVYLASFGILAVVVALYAWAWERVPSSRRSWIAWGLVAHGAFYLAVSVERNRDFSSAESAWRSVLEVYPRSHRALNTLANLLVERKDYPSAIRLYEQLIAMNPMDYYATTNLGSLYGDEGPYKDVEKALSYFQRSIQINPKIAENYYNVGRILHHLGRGAEALPIYQKALEIKPTHVPSMNNLAALYLAQGNVTAAELLLKRALELDPSYPAAQSNKEILLGMLRGDIRLVRAPATKRNP